MTDDSVLYYPTPLEQAYSLYLAQQVFHVAPNLPMHLSGRSAVPFLTQSGVDRGTLRSIWTATDPQNFGTLTQLTQFQLMLRLVSMAQAGILDAQGTPDSMREAVQQYAGRILALPVFSSVVIPPHGNLMAMYGMFVIQYQQTPQVGAGDASVSSSTTMHDTLAFGSGLTSPSYGMQGVVSVNSFGAVSTVSVDDAFSDLGPTTNAPLPSLDEATSSLASPPTTEIGGELPPPSTSDGLVERSFFPGNQDLSMVATGSTPAPAPVTDADDDEEEEFGDFEDVGSASAPAVVDGSLTGPPPSTTVEMKPSVSGGGTSHGPLGNFGDNSNQPLPSLGGGSSSVDPSFGVPQVASLSDDFGGFTTAPGPNQVGMFDQVPQPTMAAPSFDGSVQSSSSMDPTPITSNKIEVTTPLPISDAFGDIGVEDAPLPSLAPSFDGSVQSSSMGPTGMVTTGTIFLSEPETDDFGGFSAAPAPDQFGSFNQVPASTMATPSFDGSVQSSSMGPIATTTISQSAPEEDDVGGFSAAPAPDQFGSFDQLPASTMATLLFDGSVQSSSMGPIATTTISQSAPEEDDFGGFSAAPAPDQFGSFDQVPASTMATPSFDGSVQSSSIDPTSTTNNLEVTTPGSISDAFGDSGVEDAPLPSLDAFGGGVDKPVGGSDDVDDDFGGFETAIVGSGPPRVPGTLSFGGATSGGTAREISALSQNSGFAGGTAGSNDGDDPFSAFESIPSPHQPELPPLSTALSSDSGPASVVPETNGDEGDDDDFGDFTSPSDAMEPTAGGAPSAVLESTEDDFGGFGAAPGSGGGNDSDDPFSAFESIPSPHQPELPPLSTALSSDSGPASVVPETSGDEGDDDDFGDFTSPSDAMEPTAGGAPSAVLESTEDDFGGFGAAPGSGGGNDSDDPFSAFESIPSPHQPELPPLSTALSSDSGPASVVPETSGDEGDDDDFGDFASPSDAMEPIASGAPSAPPEPAKDDLFGSLDDASPQPAPGSYPVSEEDDDLGAFGAAPNLPTSTGDGMFGSFDAALPQSASGQHPVSGEDYNFGAFDTAPAAAPESTGDDFFGAFDDAPSLLATEPNHVSGGDDDFGAFDTAPPAAPESTGDDFFAAFDDAPSQSASGPDPVSEEGDGFGAFDTAPAAAPESTGDDFFGAFDYAASRSARDDEFGAFDAAPVALVSTGDQIRDLSAPLSETLLRKSGFAGGHVDLGECFEVNIGLSSPMDAARKNRVDRCIQVLEILSKVNHNHSSTYCEQVLKVVREELVHGSSILVEAKRLSSTEMPEVVKPLQSMIAGLREYMRVARSIIATVGDILMLDQSALLTIDTMASTWCSLSILEVALEIESKWKDILREVKLILPSFSENADAPTLEEIRSGISGKFPPGNLCELTFQPLLAKNKSSTRAQVSWNGKEFMACSANLLANRCPFYIPGK